MKTPKKEEKKGKKRRKDKLGSENSEETPKRRKPDSEDEVRESSAASGAEVKELGFVDDVVEKRKNKDKRKHKKREVVDETESGHDDAVYKSKRVRTKDPSSVELAPTALSSSSSVESTAAKAAARKARRDERKRLASQLPTTDEHGIAYTKQQLRRMRKRLARGLNPIETPEEVQARLKREAELRREEEVELAGMVHESSRKTGNDGEKEVEVAGEEEDSAGSGGDEQDEGGIVSNDNPVTQPASNNKKTKREKSVPIDYVCQACQNRHAPAHWIYDCPQKVTVRGSNLVAKKLKGLHNPKNKVFVSGLPFDAKHKTLTSLFEDCGKIVHCKILKFPDTGRCKGQAYVAFETEESAQKALLVNGKVMSSDKDGRKDLKLKVTKAVNRTVTKHKVAAT